MSRFDAIRSALGFLLSTAAFYAMSVGAPSAGAETPAADLRDLLAQFQSVSSLGFSAAVQMIEIVPCDELEEGDVVPHDAPPQPITGFLEYWSSAERYMIRSDVATGKYPGLPTLIAYDGRSFQLLLSNGTLSRASKDDSTLLPTWPNPLLELLQFRYPLTDANSDQRLRLKDVQKDPIPDSFWSVSWKTTHEGGRVLERAVFPGGTYEGRSYVHHVYAAPGERHMPLRIDRVAAQGPLTSSEFLDYRRVDAASGPAYWPYKIVLTAFTDKGAAAAMISFILTDLAVDSDVPDQVFVIPRDRAERVWDDDLRHFENSGNVSSAR